MHILRRLTFVVSSSALAALTVVGTPAQAQTGQFDGVNWADPRDNYVDGNLILSGLSSGDSYATVKAKSQQFTREFYSKLGANTIRVPINPKTVNSSWWSAYRGVIDGIRAEGANVIIGYWEGVQNPAKTEFDIIKDGRIDDTTAYDAMWTKVVNAYGSDAGVMFEPMNEPFGYSEAEWIDVASAWVNRYTGSTVARSRVIIDGTGYSATTAPICKETKLKGTRVGLHNYAFWGNKNYDAWLTSWRDQVTPCPGRIIITEFGETMSNQDDFNNPSSKNGVVYLQAAGKIARDYNLGAVYWPGLRDNDGFSMTTRSGSGANQTLTVVNSSGRDLLRWAWGM